MAFDNIERTSPLQEMADYLCPLHHVGQPRQNAVRSEDDIEFFVKDIRQFIDIRANEVRLDSRLFAQGTGEGDSLIREINASHLSSQPCPGHCVHSKVALQME